MKYAPGRKFSKRALPEASVLSVVALDGVLLPARRSSTFGIGLLFTASTTDTATDAFCACSAQARSTPLKSRTNHFFQLPTRQLYYIPFHAARPRRLLH